MKSDYMTKFLYFLAGLLFLLAIVLIGRKAIFISAQAEGEQQIIINEIMYNPSGADSDHEWLEIYNNTTSTAYVINNSWRFNDGSNHTLNLVRGTSTIPAGSYALLAANAELFLQDYPSFEGNLFDTVMALNNTTDTLSLSADGGQTFFANLSYESAWGGADNGYTLARNNETWQQSFVAGGTPGQINTASPQEEQVGDNENDDQVDEEENNEEDNQQDDQEEIQDEAAAATSTPEIINNQAEENATSTPPIADGQNATSTPEQELNQQNNEQANNQANQNNNQQEIIETPEYSDQIFINEILPDPAGADVNAEFIEIYNRSGEAVDLTNWQLGDNSAKRFIIGNNQVGSSIIPAGGYLVIYSNSSKISLNNAGDTVKLFQPNGNLLNEINYNQSLIAQSYIKIGGNWLWTQQPTPGQANFFFVESENETSANAAAPSSNENLAVSAERFIDLNYDLKQYQGLRINEVLVNPSGSDSAEWIEIYNNSSSTLELFGFSLDDEAGGSKPYYFPASTTIPAFGFVTVHKEKSKISLNNNADEVRLLDPWQEVFTAFKYEKSLEGQSYNFEPNEEEWYWSANLTPGLANVFSHRLNEEIIVGENKIIPDLSAVVITPAEIKLMAKGEKATMAGVIIAPLNAVNSRAVYAAVWNHSTNEVFLEEAVQVYSSDANLLKHLLPGDLVEFSGYVSEAGNLKRLNLNKESEVNIIGKIDLPDAMLLDVASLNEDYVSGLIEVQGLITEKKGNYFFLDDESGEVKIILKSFKADKSSTILSDKMVLDKELIKAGALIKVKGILTLANNEWRIFPRSKDDLTFPEVLGAAENSISSAEIINVPADNRRGKALKYLSMLGGTIITAGLSLLAKLKLFK